jgi:hypothetical protein
MDGAHILVDTVTAIAVAWEGILFDGACVATCIATFESIQAK